jgi:putative nucleotidyltransferase with HDIG domain
MNRDEAVALVQQHVKNANLVKHCLAAEAVMAALAERLGENKEKWSLAGLLHDLDVEVTKADPKVHGLESVKMLGSVGIDPEVVDAIKMHNEEAAGAKRSAKFHHALAAAETITGLIVASTLVLPDKKLASVKPESVVRRMKEKAFARSVNRDTIRECEKIGIPLDEFARIAVTAMQGISGQIGL